MKTIVWGQKRWWNVSTLWSTNKENTTKCQHLGRKEQQTYGQILHFILKLSVSAELNLDVTVH